MIKISILQLNNCDMRAILLDCLVIVTTEPAQINPPSEEYNYRETPTYYVFFLFRCGDIQVQCVFIVNKTKKNSKIHNKQNET